MRRDHLAFVIAFLAWAIVFGQAYSFVAWIPALKQRYDLTENESLAIGTSLYAGWLIGIPTSVFLWPPIQRLAKAGWLTDLIVFAIAHVVVVAAYVMLSIAFAVQLSHAAGTVLSLLSAASAAFGVGVMFGVYFKFLVAVICTPETTQFLTGLLYAIFALGGIVGAGGVSATPDGELKWLFIGESVLHVLVGLVVNVIMASIVRKHELAVAHLQESSGLLCNSQSQEDETPIHPTMPPLSGWGIVRQFVSQTNGILVIIIMFTRTFIGPTLTTQAGIMFRSLSSDLTETDVLLTLTAGMFFGRLSTSIIGAKTYYGPAESTTLLTLVMSILFWVCCLLGYAFLNGQTVMVIAAVGGFSYGIMWATDSPLLLKPARSGEDWPVLISRIVSPLQMVACTASNFICGWFYDRRGHDTPQGVQCKGSDCFKESMLLLLISASLCTVASAVLCVRLRKPPTPTI